jgi:hypothetical protein
MAVPDQQECVSLELFPLLLRCVHCTARTRFPTLRFISLSALPHRNTSHLVLALLLSLPLCAFLLCCVHCCVHRCVHRCVLSCTVASPYHCVPEIDISEKHLAKHQLFFHTTLTHSHTHTHTHGYTYTHGTTPQDCAGQPLAGDCGCAQYCSELSGAAPAVCGKGAGQAAGHEAAYD